MALVGLAPEEVGGIGEVARLVEKQQRGGVQVVEAGRGRHVDLPVDRPGGERTDAHGGGADVVGVNGERHALRE